MIKRFLLILICVALFCSCDKQDSSEGGSDIFESQMVNLSSDKQIIDIKASETHWYMRVKEVEESMNQQLDTIRGNWYTLIKKNGGEYLSVSVASNSDKNSNNISLSNEEIEILDIYRSLNIREKAKFLNMALEIEQEKSN